MSNNKFLIMLLLACLMSGCGAKDDYPNLGFKEICIDKVLYLIKDDGSGHRGYMSVKMKPDSTVATCNLPTDK